MRETVPSSMFTTQTAPSPSVIRNGLSPTPTIRSSRRVPASEMEDAIPGWIGDSDTALFGGEEAVVDRDVGLGGSREGHEPAVQGGGVARLHAGLTGVGGGVEPVK